MIELVGAILLVLAAVFAIRPWLRAHWKEYFAQFSPSKHRKGDHSLDRIGKKLEKAGISKNDASKFVALRRSLALAGFVVGVLIFFMSQMTWWILCLPLLGFFLPKAILEKRIHKRQRSILLGIPYYLDILTLTLEAGMDLVAAFEELLVRDSENPLKEELLITLKSIQMGERRSAAFQILAERTGVEPLSMLAASISQSEELGASLGGLLRLQAETLRRDIHKNAEERAQRAPLKMLLPLVLFIFPVLFYLLFAPIWLKMLTTGL
jgi:tight adherence protein C